MQGERVTKRIYNALQNLNLSRFDVLILDQCFHEALSQDLVVGINDDGVEQVGDV